MDPGESLADYYLNHGYPAGQWFGKGAALLGLSGDVTRAQMAALFGEGRHPNADAIEAELIDGGASAKQAMVATQLGRRFPVYGAEPELRKRVAAAYRQYNQDEGRPLHAGIDENTRFEIRHRVQTELFTEKKGRAPGSEKELRGWLAEQQREQKKAVAGWEFVFAPPKSVSVAWALGDDQTRELIAGLHRQAVTDTLTHFENNAAFTREGSNGEAQVDVRGIIAAIWEHWDSRAGDPHLHVHATISAKAQRATDHKWTTLDGRTILAAAVTLSEHYDSRMRDLCRDHGASWTQRMTQGIAMKRPVWELDGVAHELIEGFSTRAQVVEADRARRIVAFRDEHGHEPTPKDLWEISTRAQYATRMGKQAPKTLSEHLTEWRAAASSMRDAQLWRDMGQRVFGGAGEALSQIDIPALAASTLAVVQDHRAHFTRWNLEAEAHRQTAGLRVATDAREAVVGAIADAIVGGAETVTLRSPSLVAEPDALRRASGKSVFLEHNSTRYSTTVTLRCEQQLAEFATQAGGHRLKEATVARAMLGEALNDGQRRMITQFARSGRRVQLALAPAGAGKTTAMRVFGAAWRKAGGRVFAFGPSARAAAELGEAMQASPHTLHQLTTALTHGSEGHNFGFRSGDVLVIDEAAMAGTHTLHRVVDYALNLGGDVRLVADDAQLGAVEAGGAVRLIAADAGVVRFTEVVRFRDPDQAAASLKIRDGNPDGLEYYLDHGRVSDGSLETIRHDAHAAWRADLDAGKETLLIVPDLDDVLALNLQARALRQARGDLTQDTEVPLHDGSAAGVGDWVVTRLNNRDLQVFGGKDFVKNGDTWHVTGFATDGSLRVTHRQHGGTAILPPPYAAQHVELAYAVTINRCQGMNTRDSSHTVVPQRMTREQFYPSITRAADRNLLYVETVHHVADSHHETPPEQQPRAVLFGVLQHVGVETSATEQLRAGLTAEETLDTLITRYNYAAHLGAHSHYTDLITAHAPAALNQPAEPALRQTLLNAHDLGWNPRDLVHTALRRGGIDHADDPAALLQWRIERHITGHHPPAPTGVVEVERHVELLRQHAPETLHQPTRRSLLAALHTADERGYNAETLLPQMVQQRTLRGADDPAAVLRWRIHRHLETHPPPAQRPAQQSADTTLQPNPVLPWQAHGHHPHAAGDGDLARYLAELNAAIHTRATELLAQTTQEQPLWTAGLGPRPANAADAQRWDRVVGLAAAYRETNRITSNDPAQPLGPAPDGHTTRTRAYRQLTREWSTTMTTPDEHDLDLSVDALRQRRLADHEHNPHGHTADEDSERSNYGDDLQAAECADWYDRYDDDRDQHHNHGYHHDHESGLHQ